MSISMPLIETTNIKPIKTITLEKYLYYIKIVQKLLLKDIKGQANINKGIDLSKTKLSKLIKDLVDEKIIEEKKTFKHNEHTYSFLDPLEKFLVYLDNYINKYEYISGFQPLKDYDFIKEFQWIIYPENRKFLNKVNFIIPDGIQPTFKIEFTIHKILMTFALAISIRDNKYPGEKERILT